MTLPRHKFSVKISSTIFASLFHPRPTTRPSSALKTSSTYCTAVAGTGRENAILNSRVGARDERHEREAAHQSHQVDDGLLAAVLGGQIRQVSPLGLMLDEGRPRRAARDPHQRLEDSRQAEQGQGDVGQVRGQKIEEEGRVVRRVREQPKRAKVGLRRGARGPPPTPRTQPPLLAVAVQTASLVPRKNDSSDHSGAIS